jgi:hypothetical protein
MTRGPGLAMRRDMNHLELSGMALAALAAFLPFCAVLFGLLPARTAVLSGFVAGYLFLPQGERLVPGVLPDIDRFVVTHCALLLGVVLLDFRRLSRLRPHALDLPIIVLCATPFFSSVTNGLGAYDGLSGVMSRSIGWGIPYLLGRAYLADDVGMRKLALAIVIGGLLYVPLCLLEVRLSPQLHNWAYGYHQHSFYQTYRLSGFRPTVFMQHGLAVGLWMASASLLGVWLLVSGAISKRRRAAFGALVLALLATTVLCKSLGSLILLSVGVGALLVGRLLGRAWPILLLLVIPPTYVVVRAREVWTGDELVSVVKRDISADRAQSLAFRLRNETALSRKALERPAFGWAGYGRAAVQDEDGRTNTIVDGYWIQAMGQNGVVGLLALGGVLMVPVVVFLRSRGPRALWVEAPEGTGLAALLAIVSLDDLMNAMFSPFPVLAAAALTGCVIAGKRARAVAVPAAEPVDLQAPYDVGMPAQPRPVWA